MVGMTMAEVRTKALEEANKTLMRPVFLGSLTTPGVVDYQTRDVLRIAKRYATYIETGE